MTRTSLISAVALIAVLGSATASFAYGDKGMGPRGGMMPDFATLDADGDGQVTQAELDAQKAARFAEIDADGDGSVTAEELAAYKDAKDMTVRTERFEMMISRMDVDGDGALSADEMSGAVKKTPLERLDTDGDGSISEEEFAAAASARGDRGGDRGERGHGKGGKGKGHK
ncbi:MAG: Ca2+-binding EF-hand superfamily protein [Celeribacter sp.]|jgi:Ca2+-binding EF-hand superfamily protein